MTELVRNLLFLYAGILILNLGLSVALWARVRSRDNRNLCLLWGLALLCFFVQGMTTGHNDLVVSLGFSTVFFLNLVFADLLAEMADSPKRVGAYQAIYAASIGIAAVVYALGGPFWAVSLPLALAASAPLLVTGIELLHSYRHRLSFVGRMLPVVAIGFALHNLDYPFLRNLPDFTAVGFTIAILLVFALAITAPAAVLERQAEENVRLLEIGRLKNAFFANVSHELRTPLTLILTPVQELMAHAGRSEAEQNVLRSVQRNAIRLLRFIDELLELARLDGRRVRIRVSELDLAGMAQTLVQDSQAAAAARGIELRAELETVWDAWGDAHRIDSVLTNLIGNAIKYGREGGRIEVTVIDRGDEAAVSVADDGPGISAAEQERIFERFYQVGRPKSGGAGIGLALARELVELHGGRLEVESSLGRGSRFTMVLRKGRDHLPESLEEPHDAVAELARRRADRLEADAFRRPKAPRSGTFDDMPVDGARVVIAEDNEELRGYVSRLLRADYEVLEARDAAEAFELVRREKPALVLTDIMMPGDSGVELCRRIKADDELRRIPVILLTAMSGTDVTLDAYASGADDFVAKPFHPGVLLARVRAQLQIRALGLRLVSQEKLAAVGTMAAGLAHELKNPLNSILNAARALERRPEDPALAARLLPVIADGASRMDGIVSALGTHARPADRGGVSAFDLAESLDSTLRLIEHRLSGITVHRTYASDAIAVAEPGAVNQVLLNLLDNAVRSGASNLYLETRSEGERVAVAVSDDGPGVPAELQRRIFDPFFTTRDPGAGTGLGLYLSRSLIADQGGMLRYRDREGGGARFEIDLPGRAGQRGHGTPGPEGSHG